MQGKAGNPRDQRYFAFEQSESGGADRRVLVADSNAGDFNLVTISLHPRLPLQGVTAFGRRKDSSSKSKTKVNSLFRQ